MKFKVGDKVRIKKIQTGEDQFLGQAGMVGIVTSANSGIKMATLGEDLEYQYTMDLWWSQDPDRVVSESFPESYLELRHE